ncbi:MAG: TonB-dependent receptor [Proteobacteria bacterium]|nr:TonB-dependent receptor [Pseudomonadota bacterium]
MTAKTGTNIRGAELIGSAVQTIDSKSLAESGKTGIGDYLRELPVNFAGGVGMSDNTQSGQDAGSAGANLTGGQGVNLRALGALSTLVLINGRRAAASGQFGDFVDVSTIPVAAIERIDILQDGASAVYGSDAVGGVANFVLRRSIDRPVTTLKFGPATQGGGEELFANQLIPLEWDSGNMVIGGEYYSRNAVKQTDRDPYSGGSDYSGIGGIDWRSFNARLSPQANIYLGGPGSTSGASPVGAVVPAGSNAALTGAGLVPVTDGIGNTVNVFDATDIIPEIERYSVFASLDHTFGSGVELFADARFSHREHFYNNGYGSLLSAALTPASPYYIAGIDPSLTDAGGNIGFGYQFDDRPETREGTVDSIDATVGLRFDIFSDWQLQTALTYSDIDQNRFETKPRAVDVSRLNYLDCALGSTNPDCAAAGATPFNPWSTDPLTAAQIDEYFGFENLDFNSDLMRLTAQIDGTLATLPAGEVLVAFGAEFRSEEMDGFLTETTINPTPGEGPYEKTSRDVVSVFTEFQIPLHETLDVTLAGRYEEFTHNYASEYDDFNPKFGVNFRPADGLKLRASWGTSFHAPPMRFENDAPQPVPGGNASFMLNVSRFGPCDSTLVTFNGIIGTPGTPGGQCSFTLLINSGGAGPGVLKPEEATTWTLGFDYAPPGIEGLNISLSYFDIEVEDRIQRIQSGTLDGILAEWFSTNGGGAFQSALTVPTLEQAQAAVDNPKFLGTFGPPFANTPADIQLIVNATQLNIAALRESGFDFGVSYDFPASDSLDLGLFAYGTYLRKYELQAAPGLDFIDNLGKYTSFGSPVQLRSKQGIRATTGTFDGVLTLNYVDSYECATGSCFVADAGTGLPVINTAPVPIDSWLTVDLSLGLELSDFGNGIFTDGARISLSVNNLFDEDPPFIDAGGTGDPRAPAYDPNNHTIIGRTVGLTFTKEW